MEEQHDLRRCILGGITVLTLAVSIVVSACVYVPAANAVTSAPAFRTTALALAAVGLLLLLSTIVVSSHTYQRVVFSVVTLSLTALLVVAAHAVSSQATVVVMLVTAALLTGVAAVVGSKLEDASALGWPLLVGLLVLLCAGLLNGLVFHAHWLETVYSLVAVSLFTVFAVYDSNAFVRRRQCRYSCCEEGVFNLFLDFANIAANLMNLNASTT